MTQSIPVGKRRRAISLSSVVGEKSLAFYPQSSDGFDKNLMFQRHTCVVRENYRDS